MKILISPAKEFKFDKPVEKDWDINEKTEKLVAFLKTLHRNELKSLLNVSDLLLFENREYIKNFDTPITYRASDMYNGLAHRNMGLKKLSKEDRSFLDEHVLMLSALYGPIKPSKLIKPYRLDFNMAFRIDNISLKKYWVDYFNSSIEKGERVYNLASNEYSSIFNRELFDWVDFDFYELVDGEKKHHSTISKKARGKMLAFIYKHKITEIEDIKSFKADGYRFVEEKSNKSLLVFEKEV